MDRDSRIVETDKPRPRLTMAQIAKQVGVSRAAVSAVLNPGYKTIKISSETRARIQKVVDQCQFFPDATGQSLKSKRTGHIGFILSDTVADGWSNIYFSQILAGVETACHYRGYGLNVSRYNLSNIDSFVFPRRIGQRSVDGLVLAGVVQAAIVQRFQECQIPCVCVGEDVEVAGLIPTVSCDIVTTLYQAVAYAGSLGHTRIGYCYQPTPRGVEAADLLVRFVQSREATRHVQISRLETAGDANYQSGRPLVERWMATPEAERVTCLISNDQVVVAMLKELARRGLRCPQDVGLISTVNSNLCEYSDPGLTSLHLDLPKMGEVAATILLEYLEDGVPLRLTRSRKDFPASFVVRESCIRVQEMRTK